MGRKGCLQRLIWKGLLICVGIDKFIHIRCPKSGSLGPNKGLKGQLQQPLYERKTYTPHLHPHPPFLMQQGSVKAVLFLEVTRQTSSGWPGLDRVLWVKLLLFFFVLAEPGPEELGLQIQQDGFETTRVPTPRPRDGRCHLP